MREHWPNVISLLQDQSQFFARHPRDALVQRDARLGHVYVLAQMDASLYLVMVLPAERRKHEQAARTFVESLSRQLRNESIFARLVKPT